MITMSMEMIQMIVKFAKENAGFAKTIRRNPGLMMIPTVACVVQEYSASVASI
jgi:hypothetical protein